MRRNARWRRTSSLLVLSACAAGCSLINAFDDLSPQKAAGDDGGTVGPGSDANAPDTSAAGDDSGGGGDSGPPDGGDLGPRGAIVVGGTALVDGGDQPVLTALDPATGSELPNAREPMNVAAVLYDGVRDVWYVFEAGGTGSFPLPGDPFYLHTRTLDVRTGTWTELAKIAVPAGLSFTTTDVVSNRVVYVAYGNDASDAGIDAGATVPSPYGLVVVDTTDPARPAVSSVVALTAPPVALVGARSVISPTGGFMSLASTVKNGANTYAQITPVLLPSSGDPPQIEQPIVGDQPVGGTVGFIAVTGNGPTHVAVIGRTFGAPSVHAQLEIFDPAASDPAQALVAAGNFAFGDGNVKAPAFAPCQSTLLVLGTNSDLSLYAVPLTAAGQPLDDGGSPLITTASAPTGHSGQAVYFEPFTNTVLTPFGQGNNFALTAFTLQGTAEHPQLVQRVAPRWSPPPDLRPSFIATRSPYPAACPVEGDH